MATELIAVVGGMFSSKTRRLIEYLDNAKYARQRVVAMKPPCDSRTGDEIATRKKKGGTFVKMDTFPAFPVRNFKGAMELILKHRPDVLGIDEGQFFGEWLKDFINAIRFDKINGVNVSRIIISGLDMDFRGEPFGCMPYFLATATEVYKVKAVCFKCGKPADMTQKLRHSDEIIEVGDRELYEARCRDCHTIPAPDA